MKLYEKTLASETKFEGRIIKVILDDVELENGKVKNLHLIGTTNMVCKGEVTDEELCIHQNAEE